MSTVRIGSLFSGAGGLDMAVEAVFDGKVAWHCEVEPSACKVLAERWPDVPNLGSVLDVDWEGGIANGKPFDKDIDILVGGFP